MHPAPTRTGLDVLRRGGFDSLRGRRLGLLVHPAAVASDLAHVIDLAIGAGLNLRVLLGPEHGLSGTAQDMEAVRRQTGSYRNIPVVSLYGDGPESLRPPSEVLAEVDVLVVDLQDVGCRYYTYASTMRLCMEACADAGVAVVVLDRPNPIGGVFLEGPLLEDDFRSFVGSFPVPVRHGLTIGELALLAKSEREGVDVDLQVVTMEGWRREMWFDQTRLPWIMPSPNLPTVDTATVYPGGCLVESTNLSEGRGTTRPFELLGAPWLDKEALANVLRQSPLEGATFRPVTFTPTFHKHAGVLCQGIQVHVTDRSVFKPFLFGLLFLQACQRQAPSEFAWRKEPYEFVADRPAIDLLTGTSTVRKALEQGKDLGDLPGLWQKGLGDFSKRRRDLLLYPEENP